MAFKQKFEAFATRVKQNADAGTAFKRKNGSMTMVLATLAVAPIMTIAGIFDFLSEKTSHFAKKHILLKPLKLLSSAFGGITIALKFTTVIALAVLWVPMLIPGAIINRLFSIIQAFRGKTHTSEQYKKLTGSNSSSILDNCFAPFECDKERKKLKAANIEQELKAAKIEQELKAAKIEQELKAPKIEQELKAPKIEQELKAPKIEQELKAANIEQVKFKQEKAVVIQKSKAPKIEQEKALVIQKLKAPKIEQEKAVVIQELNEEIKIIQSRTANFNKNTTIDITAFTTILTTHFRPLKTALLLPVSNDAFENDPNILELRNVAGLFPAYFAQALQELILETKTNLSNVDLFKEALTNAVLLWRYKFLQPIDKCIVWATPDLEALPPFMENIDQSKPPAITFQTSSSTKEIGNNDTSPPLDEMEPPKDEKAAGLETTASPLIQFTAPWQKLGDTTVEQWAKKAWQDELARQLRLNMAIVPYQKPKF